MNEWVLVHDTNTMLTHLILHFFWNKNQCTFCMYAVFSVILQPCFWSVIVTRLCLLSFRFCYVQLLVRAELSMHLSAKKLLHLTSQHTLLLFKANAWMRMCTSLIHVSSWKEEILKMTNYACWHNFRTLRTSKDDCRHSCYHTCTIAVVR